MKPLWAVIAVALVATIVGATLFGIHRAHAAHRQAAVDAMKMEQRKLESLEARLENLEQQLHTVVNHGDSLSTRRHDRGINGADESELLRLAKQEHGDVTKAKALNEKIGDSGISITQDYAVVFGNATARLQAEMAAQRDSCENSLTDWEHAIGDIQDGLEESINGTELNFPNVEQLYTSSEHEYVQCMRHKAIVKDELRTFDRRVASDIRVATTAIKMF
jgi:hypothetical protein